MPILYATGFEAGSLTYYQEHKNPWGVTNGSITTNATYQHRTATGIGGNYSAYIDDYWAMQGPLTGTPRWFHVWGKPNGPSQGALFLAVNKDGNTFQQFGIHLLSNGSITFYRGSTLVQTSVGVWNPAVAHWFAVEFFCDNAGQCAVWVDGVNVATFVGDTQQHTVSGWDAFGFAAFWQGGQGNNNYYVDDVIITDSVTGRLTEQVCAPLIPNGDTAQADFTPSSGVNHYAMVDEVPASETDYNAASAAGQEDRYTFTDLPAGVSTVTCAVFTARSTRDGSITKGEVSVKSGATTVYQTPVQLAAAGSYMSQDSLRETDPNTGIAWTTGGINAVEAGFRFNS